MDFTKQLFLSLIFFSSLIACNNSDNSEGSQEESVSKNYELPKDFDSKVPHNYRDKYGKKAKSAFTQSDLRESKSTFSLGPKQGQIIGFFEGETQLFLIADYALGQNNIKEYYFYNENKKCYYAAVLKKDNNSNNVLHTYWMIPETDSIYYEMFYPKTVDPINLFPLEKPANAYVMNPVELDSHISPSTMLAFTSTPNRAPATQQAGGQYVKKIQMGNNETGMDVGILKAGETIRYQIDLNKKFNYMIAVNPLQAGFLLRGIDKGKVFIEDQTSFQWFTDEDNQVLDFELYNNSIPEGNSLDYRIGVFGEPR